MISLPPPVPNWYGFAVGASYVTVTVVGFVATTDFTPDMKSEFGSAVASSAMYLDVNTTSSAVTAVPSDHLSPLTRFHVTVVKSEETPLLSTVGISFASPFATGLPSTPHEASGS